MIRPATGTDASGVREIYAPFVTDTTVSFEEEVPSIDEMAARIEASHRWLVDVEDGVVVGYAYAGPHRSRAAYRFTVEVSAYVRPGHEGRGMGTRLYRALLSDLSAGGFETAVAGITLPNDASVGFHRAMGFAHVGVFPRVGFKFGEWHDTVWMSRPL